MTLSLENLVLGSESFLGGNALFKFFLDLRSTLMLFGKGLESLVYSRLQFLHLLLGIPLRGVLPHKLLL